MRKYLMTGVAAIALSAAFTSCSKGDELYDADAAKGISTEQAIAKVYDNYNQAFIKTFGQPAANQDWGFGSAAALTRAVNTNANEWADPDKEYGGLLVPPPLTDEQKAVVKKYFQTVQKPTYEDPHWTNYFMQQVYKGYTAPMTGTDPKTGKPYSPEWYKAADGNTRIYASNNMDHLAAIDGTFVDHINNFNHGDCSENNNVLDNGYHTNDNKFHSDKIMYMKESTTKSFGYYNSNGSVCRTEYTGLVGFQTIINELGAEANCLNDGWNRSFMGFDFEQMVGPEIISQEKYSYKGKEYPVLLANQNMYCGIFYKKADGSDLNDTDLQQEGFIDNLLAEGYLPVSGGAGKKWVKVGGCADGYYSDWIVCLTEAKTSQTPPPSDWEFRVIAEDLNAAALDAEQAKDGLTDSDWDFNDVVFDAKWKDNTTATIKVKVVGGVLPLYIGNAANPRLKEVHELFGATKNSEGLYSILGERDDAQEFDVTGLSKSLNGRDIVISVVRPLSTGEEALLELKAVKSLPAAKIRVKTSFKPCAEREDIRKKYELFTDWVTSNPEITWY